MYFKVSIERQALETLRSNKDVMIKILKKIDQSN